MQEYSTSEDDDEVVRARTAMRAAEREEVAKGTERKAKVRGAQFIVQLVGTLANGKKTAFTC